LLAIGFVMLSTVSMVAAPIVLFFIVFGTIGGVIFAAIATMFWLVFTVWLVRVRRRRFGRFWPTKWA
jgi:hypothetical protein